MATKIYTKTGDTVKTSLLGGTRVPKHNLRIETYGTADELNAWIGLLRDQKIKKHHQQVLVQIQDRLFTIGSNLALDPKKDRKNPIAIPRLQMADTEFLEAEIDRMTALLPEMRFFVLPGGHSTVSYAHIARCVCRRLERNATHLAEIEKTDPLILVYINRLSDYLFVLSRMLTAELKAKETPWKPRL